MFPYIKVPPTHYVIHYAGGKIRHAGAGLAFFYFRPTASIVIVPIGSADVPFVFNEISGDFQPLTVQGQLAFRVSDPQKVAALLNYEVTGLPGKYVSDDPQKLPQRIVNLVQVLVRAEIQHLPLREAIHASELLATSVFTKLKESPDLPALGVEALTFTIQGIKPVPESARALEAEAREELMRRADQAIYDRRNAAVEQERRIKENELNTEIAVEEKKRQIRETQVEANLAVEAKEQQVREAKIEGQIKLENERKRLVLSRTENARAEADAQAYAMQASLATLKDLSPDVLQLLSTQTADPRLMVSTAFKELAKNAGKIGQLNISPDLLETLLKKETGN